MRTHADYANGTVTIRRFFAADPQAVFDAWIESEKVQDWWGCADTTKVVSEVEPKVGGRYAHAMTLRGAHEHLAAGVFTEFDPPNVLAYGINAPEEGGHAAMHVRVEFAAKDGGTEVTLTHTGIPDEFSVFIVDGWSAAFGRLHRFLYQNARAA